MREASLCCVQLKCALQKRGERDASRVHSGGVNAALVSRDGRLAVTLSKDCTARVWDLETGTCRHVLVGGRPFCICNQTPPGCYMDIKLRALSNECSVGNKASACREVRCDFPCRAQSLECCLTCFAGHSEGPETGAMSVDGSMVLTAAHDKSARVWDLASGKCLAMLACSAQVRSACLSPST